MTIDVRRIVFIGLAVALCAGCDQGGQPMSTSKPTPPSPPAGRVRPNVVLISVDTLRPDHLGCYGYSRNTSPTIDRLAREGVLFENVISSTSWTLPAHAAMFTGLCDSVHGAMEAHLVLHEDHHTLAERLKEAGYTTVGFFSGPFLHPSFGLSQGFDEYIDCSSYRQPDDGSATSTTTLMSDAVWHEAYRDITSPRILQEVQGWFDDNTGRPFFMFIHMWDVHFDFIPPPPYDTRFDPDYSGSVTGENFFLDTSINEQMPRRDIEHLIALYDGEIAWTDEHIGKIVDRLEQLNLLDTTVLVLTADHGTAFFEHGQKAHRNSLYDELIRIPLIIRYPAVASPGQRFEEQVRMIDLMPTILRFLKIRPGNVMGQNLTPLLRGKKLKRIEPAISELFSQEDKMRSFRLLERKTIWTYTDNRGAVFDLGADPGELAPISDGDSPIAQAARVDLRWSEQFLSTFRDRFPQAASRAEVPAEVQKQLIELGYVEDRDEEEEPDERP